MDIVPDEILEPPDAYSSGFSADDTALVLDAYLRRLASQETRCRLVLGALAAGFLRRACHHELGFARLGDHARERLGLSAREVQSLASVSTRLEELPLMRAALSQGRLSWTQARLLVGVARTEDEARWLELAEGRTVRALEALICDARTTPTTDHDTEPCVEFRLRCPRRLLALWRDTVELGRRMAGAQITQGDVAEAIAAEGVSARSPTRESWPMGWQPPEPVRDPTETHAVFPPVLDWTAVAEAIPEDVERLCADLDACDPFTLDARMRVVVRALQRIDWQMGRLLRLFMDRRLHRAMQFPSAARYLRERLGMSARKARALVALERKTWTTPGLADAYRAGDLSWVRALTILPVVSESTGGAWIARAQAVTVRRLLDEVEWALVARDGLEPIEPPPTGAALVTPERQMRAHDDWEYPDAEITFRAPVSVVALFRTAILTFAPPPYALWQGLERLLRHVKAEWEAQPRHRDPIFARDGWRCAVPACTSRRNLHDHHIVFRSRGGDNTRDNRITVCAWHHLRGIHAGRVRARGEAPDGITWELGVRHGHRPLVRLHGDRYLGLSQCVPPCYARA
jgi:hypothetical protein